jgi:hypothetical protein
VTIWEIDEGDDYIAEMWSIDEKDVEKDIIKFAGEEALDAVTSKLGEEALATVLYAYGGNLKKYWDEKDIRDRDEMTDEIMSGILYDTLLDLGIPVSRLGNLMCKIMESHDKEEKRLDFNLRDLYLSAVYGLKFYFDDLLKKRCIVEVPHDLKLDEPEDELVDKDVMYASKNRAVTTLVSIRELVDCGSSYYISIVQKKDDDVIAKHDLWVMYDKGRCGSTPDFPDPGIQLDQAIARYLQSVGFRSLGRPDETRWKKLHEQRMIMEREFEEHCTGR